MSDQKFKLSSPVLLLAFKRPDTTERVFEAIKRARPSNLYVAVDGAREGVEGEAEKVQRVREITTKIDWPCKLSTLFRSNNLGGPRGCSEAISWFFKHEEQGIVLEDDTLPHEDFFRFCDEILDRYKNENRILSVTGNNFQNGRIWGAGSYYFSKYPLFWGWAAWRRTWRDYDLNIPFWPEFKNSPEWQLTHPDSVERNYWNTIFDKVYSGEAVHWDYALMANIWFKSGLTVTPNTNLVTNIGFGPDGSNCFDDASPVANVPNSSIGSLIEPISMNAEVDADRYLFDFRFAGRNLRWPRVFVIVPFRMVRNLFRSVKNLVS